MAWSDGRFKDLGYLTGSDLEEIAYANCDVGEGDRREGGFSIVGLDQLVAVERWILVNDHLTPVDIDNPIFDSVYF